MERSEVMDLVRSHLAAELDLDPARIAEDSRFREDFDADSLDLYELVMELEEEFEINIPDDAAEKIQTVGQAVEFIEKHQS